MAKGGMHGEGGNAWQRGAYVAKGRHVWQRGGMHGEGGHVWLRGVCVVKGGMHGMHGWSLRGRYASYWNAFLLDYAVDSFFL